MSFIQSILIDNFSVKFRVKIEKINVFGDFNNHIVSFIQFIILSNINLIINEIIYSSL